MRMNSQITCSCSIPAIRKAFFVGHSDSTRSACSNCFRQIALHFLRTLHPLIRAYNQNLFVRSGRTATENKRNNNTKSNNPSPYCTFGISLIYGIITTIRKHIVTQEALSRACKGIRIDESAGSGVVISGLQVVEPGFSGGAVAGMVCPEILYHISGSVARRKLASAHQILRAGFGH